MIRNLFQIAHSDQIVIPKTKKPGENMTITVDLMSISKLNHLQYSLLCPKDKMTSIESSSDVSPANMVLLPSSIVVKRVENTSIIPILNAVYDFSNVEQEKAIKELLVKKGINAWLDSDPVVLDGWGITEITDDDIEEGSVFMDDEGNKNSGFYAFKENWEPEGYIGPFDDINEAIAAAKEFDLENLINED